jgi:hypothetical protein
MKAVLPLLGTAMLLAACVPSTPVPAPAPVPRPAQPVPPQAPASSNWMDIAQTPGEWRHGAQGSRSEASFWSAAGAPMLRLRCQADSRSIVLSLPESGAPSPLVTIRTETATRTLQAQPAGRETLVPLNPNDSLLDAIALSKGRFAVEAEGLPTLYLPTWAEVSRVIEDCR